MANTNNVTQSNNTGKQSVSCVTFHVFRKDGSRNPDIKYSFLERQMLTLDHVQDKYLTLEDGTKWELVLETEVSRTFAVDKEVYCLLSYQARVNGNFVVARLFVKDYKPKGRHS